MRDLAYDLSPSTPKLGFHIPPFSSVPHLHLHVLAGKSTFLGRFKYRISISDRDGRVGKGWSWFVTTDQVEAILRRGDSVTLGRGWCRVWDQMIDALDGWGDMHYGTTQGRGCRTLTYNSRIEPGWNLPLGWCILTQHMVVLLWLLDRFLGAIVSPRTDSFLTSFCGINQKHKEGKRRSKS
jgi:hypothetical protein